MLAMQDMLALSASLPSVEFAPGEIVVEEGGSSGALWILVSGALRVRKGAVVVNTVTRPGALIGEIAVLLDGVNGATVEATEPSVLRHAADGKALLASDPLISRLVAIGLAERLNFVTDLSRRPEAAVRRRARALDGERRPRPARAAAGPERPAGLGARPEPGVLTGASDGASRSEDGSRRRPGRGQAQALRAHHRSPRGRSLRQIDVDMARHRADLPAGVEDPGGADPVGPRSLAA